MRSAAGLGAADPVAATFPHPPPWVCSGGSGRDVRRGSGAGPGGAGGASRMLLAAPPPPRTGRGLGRASPGLPTLTPPPPAGPSVLRPRLSRPAAASASSPERTGSFQRAPGFVPPSPMRRGSARGAEGMAALWLGKCLSPGWEPLTAPILFCGWFWAVGWLAGGQARSLSDALGGRGRGGVTHPARRPDPACALARESTPGRGEWLPVGFIVLRFKRGVWVRFPSFYSPRGEMKRGC